MFELPLQYLRLLHGVYSYSAARGCLSEFEFKLCLNCPYSIFAYFMASMATLVAAMNNTNVRVTRKKALVQDFLHTRKIPGRLGTKVRNYFEYVLDRQLHSDEAQLIAELPSSLRRQVRVFECLPHKLRCCAVACQHNVPRCKAPLHPCPILCVMSLCTQVCVRACACVCVCVCPDHVASAS